MDAFICNKCFVTIHRGKKPFSLTQCGHIYCYGCIRQAEKQCPQCQQIDVHSIELQQPSISKVENFFAPLNEALESVYKICGFQQNQIKILTQRFCEIDKKYEMLKSHYYNITQNMKAMRNKYVKLKMEYEECKKRLMSFEVQNSLSDTSTSVRCNNHRNTNIRSGSNSYFPSCEMSNQSLSARKGTMSDFRTPYVPSIRSIRSRGISDTNPTYTFRP